MWSGSELVLVQMVCERRSMKQGGTIPPKNEGVFGNLRAVLREEFPKQSSVEKVEKKCVAGTAREPSETVGSLDKPHVGTDV